MTVSVKLKPLPFDEAIAFWRDKIQLSPEEFEALKAEARVKAFTVAGMAKESEIADIFEGIDKAIAEGVSLSEFKKNLKDLLERRGWVGKAAWRIETIFRTNVQTAYSVGRYRQMTDERVLKTHPYWMYSAINDSRTRPMHRAMDGRVFRADDPIWQTWTPPNGYNCFPPGTPVLTPSGWQPIESIRTKEWVIGGSGHKQRVTAIHRNFFDGEMVRLVFEDGFIDTTPNHRILTMRGWVRAESLKRGDVLVETRGSTGRTRPVCSRILGAPIDQFYSFDSYEYWAKSNCMLRKLTSKAGVSYAGTVYNLSVENDESYIVPGATVHNCRCQIVALTEGQLARMGKEVEDGQKVNGKPIPLVDKDGKPTGMVQNLLPDPGWHFNPAAVHYGDVFLERALKEKLTFKSIDARGFKDYHLPDAKDLPTYPIPETLWKNKSFEEIERLFEERFGKGATLEDPVGAPVTVTKKLLGHLKGKNPRRLRYLPILADLIKRPEEIWLRTMQNQAGKIRLRRLYLKRYTGERENFVIVMDVDQGIWTGWSFFDARKANYLNNVRTGYLLWKK